MAQAADKPYYGACNRCKCEYLGEGSLNCPCGHSAYSHVRSISIINSSIMNTALVTEVIQ